MEKTPRVAGLRRILAPPPPKKKKKGRSDKRNKKFPQKLALMR